MAAVLRGATVVGYQPRGCRSGRDMALRIQPHGCPALHHRRFDRRHSLATRCNPDDEQHQALPDGRDPAHVRTGLMPSKHIKDAADNLDLPLEREILAPVQSYLLASRPVYRDQKVVREYFEDAPPHVFGRGPIALPYQPPSPAAGRGGKWYSTL